MAITIPENWYGPWYSYSAQVVRDGSIIVDDIHQFRRHTYENGVFRTEKINIEKWWDLGYRYKDLPQGSLHVEGED